MKKTMDNFCYMISLQFLGFRYSGWQKQPNVKTVEEMVEKSLKFTLLHSNFKIMGCSRTDSKVSANQYFFTLFTSEKVQGNFIDNFNENLPADIKALDIKETDKNFSIINSPKTKEYLYLFSSGEKPHPFSAPLMYTCLEVLDIDLMKKGAKLFEGKHNFKKYCTKPKKGTELTREIIRCEIMKNDEYRADFFPKESFMLKIESKGFLRYQVRLIMGQLIKLGKGKIGLEDIEGSLNPKDEFPLKEIAPASGLILNKVKI